MLSDPSLYPSSFLYRTLNMKGYFVISTILMCVLSVCVCAVYGIAILKVFGTLTICYFSKEKLSVQTLYYVSIAFIMCRLLDNGRPSMYMYTFNSAISPAAGPLIPSTIS